MAIVNSYVHRINFTMAPNRVLRDPSLSLKAKGLLVYLMSHAPGYRLSAEQIIAESSDGRDAVRAGMGELEKAGWLQRQPLRDAHGRAVGVDYIVTEPGDNPVDESVDKAPARFTGAGKPVGGVEQGELPISAGGPGDGFSGAGESPTKKTNSKKIKEDEVQKNPPAPSSQAPKGAKEPRGTRLPEDFKPTPEMIEWSRINTPLTIAGEGGLREHQKFMNFWLSKAGAGARKIDWERTWKNWFLTAEERKPRANGQRAPQVQQFKSAAVQNQELQDRRRKVYQMMDTLAEQQGLNLSEHEVMKATRAAAEKIVDSQAESLDTCPPIGYIDADVIDVRSTREVTG